MSDVPALALPGKADYPRRHNERQFKKMGVKQRDIQTVCVYCGSATGDDDAYLKAARALGKTLAEADIRLIYGGGGIGLMGATALAAHEAGGKVVGIMPNFLKSREILYENVENRIVTTMHERKMMMFEEADAFVVLPGGIGTLEEVIELLSWRRLDLHKKPIIFVNTNGFWETLFEMIRHSVKTGFTPANFQYSYLSVDTIEEVLPAINEMRAFDMRLDSRNVL